MTTDTRIKPGTYSKESISIRRDQREWLEQEAERQLHGNRSRIVQDAIDLYRRHLEVERQLRQVA